MASLRLDGFDEEEKRRLVEDVFEDNIDFLSETLDADQYVNALRSKRSLRPDHADEIFQATTWTRKNNILLSALRKSDDPLRALSNLIDVINSKGYQPHVAKRLSQNFARKKKDFRESRGLPGNPAALTQPLPPTNNRDTPPAANDHPSHTTTAQPPTTALPLSRERSGSGSTMYAVESVGFNEETQRLVVSRAPAVNSKRSSGPYPPPSLQSHPPPSLQSHPPPSLQSHPSLSLQSHPPPPALSSYTSGWSADVESETGSGPFPPSPGPLYEDRKDGVGPRPHSPAPLPDVEEPNGRYSNIDPEFGEKPPPPPPLANPDVDHGEFPPVMPPSWVTPVLNNSLPMPLHSQGNSPDSTLTFLPQGHPLDHTSDSSSTSSLSFTAIQNHASTLERTVDSLVGENLQLRQRVGWLEEELKRLRPTGPFARDMPNSR